MKTIHQMTKKEFVQVFGYYQNDNKAISFVDEESAKEFILVAIKHGFSVEEYEISKTFLPLYISTYTDRLLCAFYLLSKNPLDSEYFICYKKDSVWTQEENRWVETKTIRQMTPREFVQAMNNVIKEQETSNLSGRDCFEALKHLILEMPLYKQNIDELVYKMNYFSDIIEKEFERSKKEHELLELYGKVSCFVERVHLYRNDNLELDKLDEQIAKKEKELEELK